jgi:hypothetical protein
VRPQHALFWIITPNDMSKILISEGDTDRSEQAKFQEMGGWRILWSDNNNATISRSPGGGVVA